MIYASYLTIHILYTTELYILLYILSENHLMLASEIENLF